MSDKAELVAQGLKDYSKKFYEVVVRNHEVTLLELEESIQSVDLPTELKNEIKECLPIIDRSFEQVKIIREKHNSDFAFVHFVVSQHWTPIRAIEQTDMEIQNAAAALADTVARIKDKQERGLYNGPLRREVNLYYGSVQTLKLMEERANKIKKNHKLPEILPREMIERDRSDAAIAHVFKEALAQARGMPFYATQQGYNLAAMDIGIGSGEIQYEIRNFINKKPPIIYRLRHPIKFRNAVMSWFGEVDFIREMIRKYGDRPKQALKYLGYD